MENNLKSSIENSVKEKIDAGKAKIKETKEVVKEAKKQHDEKREIKRKRKFVLKIFYSLVAILLLVFAVFIAKIFVDKNQQQDEVPTYKTTSELIDVQDIAELQVANITYNSVATIDKDGKVTQAKYDKDKDVKKNVSRYISYKGEITVSYDLAKVNIEKNDLDKKYVVSVPAPELIPNVIGAEFEHIVIDKESEKDYSPAKIRELCIEDLKVKFNKDRKQIEEIAETNMQNAIKAYLTLLTEDGYEIEFQVLVEVSE